MLLVEYSTPVFPSQKPPWFQSENTVFTKKWRVVFKKGRIWVFSAEMALLQKNTKNGVFEGV